MSDVEAHLYGLLEIAGQQQAAVQSALEGFAAERVALQHERQQLAQQIATLNYIAHSAVYGAVREGFATVATDGVEAVRTATQPLLIRLAGMPETVDTAEAALRRLARWTSWRLLGWLVAFVAALVLLGWLANAATLWWYSSGIKEAQNRKAALQAEAIEFEAQMTEIQTKIAEMRANYDDLVKRGLLAKIVPCGPAARPCFRVDEPAGPYHDEGGNVYRVIKGY